jgi:purine-binding chemotaxis protein CheW
MEKQLVVFDLGSEQFGIEIAAVEGIVKMQEITKVPFAPPYMEGITNLRGMVLPVIDLKKRFGLLAEPVTKETRIITVSMDTVKLGMIVTAVSEVLTIDESVIELPQAMITNVNSEFITGVAKIDSRLVILLDLSRILSADEIQAAEKIIAKNK